MEDKMEDKIRKTGTTTVAIKCKDSIILAADKRATMGHYISEGEFQKVLPITDNIAVTIAGGVSDALLLVKLLKAQITLLKMRRDGKESTVKETANLLGSMVYSGVRRPSVIPSITGFLMGGRDRTGFHLYDIAVDGSVIEKDKYQVDGSGMMLAIAIIESNYKKNMTLNEGIKLAVAGINAAIKRDTASGNGIDVFSITDKGVKKEMTRKIDIDLKV